MRQSLTLFLASIHLLAAPTAASAQLKTPQESPAAKTCLDVGTTTIEVVYHRPALRGRELAKDLAQIGGVWRLGANAATTISFTDPVTIAGKEVPAGKYALFAMPGRERWTLVLNRNPDQWGAYYHEPRQDQLSFEAKVAAVPKREWFVDRIVAQQIEKTLALIEQAVTIQPMFWSLEWNARTLHALGETEPAIPLLERAIEDAKGKTPQGYVDNLAKLLDDWQKGEVPR